MKIRLRRLAFDLWYRFGAPPWDTNISPPELLAFIAAQPAGRALDLGCGTGTNAITLARAGWAVSGVDFSPRAIAVAQRKLRAAGVAADLRVGDVTRLDGLAGPFDLALDIGCYHGLPEAGRAAYRENLARLLAPGGHLLMYAHWKDAGSQGMGVAASDMEQLARLGRLVSRVDSLERASRPALWATFQRGA